MSSCYPSDVLNSPEEVAVLALPSVRATALATQMHTSRANLTDFNQNYPSSMYMVASATRWSANEIRQPNVTEAKLYPPRPSALAEFFGKQLQAVQNALSGAP